MNALHIQESLKKLGSKQKAVNALRFFKTGKGQYGEGDVFIGVTVPEQRRIAHLYADLNLSEISTLLSSNIHECRLTALIILVAQYRKGSPQKQGQIVKFYLDHVECINNWDLVDASAAPILGTHLFTRNRKMLYALARRKNMWERRIAIVATHSFIRAGDTKDALLLSAMLLSDQEDLMHKAVGWTLREVGKQSQEALVTFLRTHVSQMPRTTLRYAIEHFKEQERKQFLRMK